MGNENLIFVILGMALVTYIPRMLPFVVFKQVEFPPLLQAMLKNLRYAVLGALIFPGIFFVHEDPVYGIIGGTTAAVLSYFGLDLVFVIFGAIGVLTLLSLLS